MRQSDYELTQICTFLGVVFLLWLMYALAIAGANSPDKCLRGNIGSLR